MAIIRTTGFVQLRRGLMEHVADGSMTVYQAWIFVSILINADPQTGVWKGSAALLSKLFSIDERYCRRALAKLEKQQYIRRFSLSGKNGSFPIAVQNFECTSGSMTGKRLNAIDSVDYDHLIYCDVRDMSVVAPGPAPGLAPGPVPALFKREKKQEKREEELSSAKRVGDPRHQEFKSTLADYWEYANPGDEMPWDGSEAKQLAALLKASPNFTAEKFKRCLHHRHQSDGVNTTKRPREWLASLTNYAAGPLNQFQQPKGTSNGKARTDQIARDAATVLYEREKQRRMAHEPAGEDADLFSGHNA